MLSKRAEETLLTDDISPLSNIFGRYKEDIHPVTRATLQKIKQNETKKELENRKDETDNLPQH